MSKPLTQAQQIKALQEELMALKEAASKPAGTTIQHCSVVNTSAANKHTRAAVVALAEAVTANANAIIAVANGLKGSPATMERGISLDNFGNSR